MSKNNETFIKTVRVEEIPWHRLTTTYGRATDFPVLFGQLLNRDHKLSDRAGETIAMNIEHQSTLWHATPFALIFLCRIAFDEAVKENWYLVKNLLELFRDIEEGYLMGEEMEHEDPLPFMEDMLLEEFLWSEVYDEDEDIARYEENPFEPDLFYSFYYYSHMVIRQWQPEIEKLLPTGSADVQKAAADLLGLLKNE